MSFQFTKATKEQAKLRMALVGPSGSGKTFTALKVAAELGGRVALIDTEHGSASKYADLFDFDTLSLATYAPLTYVEAIGAAAQAGYDVLVIDSLSHAWSGKDGALEQVDQATARSRSHNKFTDGWREVTPMHNQLIDAIIGSPLHVIATMRVKTEYVIEEDSRGKKVPRKVGLAPVQRNGMEYEFDLVGDIDLDHKMVVSKSRCPELADAVLTKPGKEFAQTLAAWLGAGEPVVPVNRKPLDDAIARLAVLDTVTDWQAAVGRAAEKDFGRPIALLKQGEVDAIAARLVKHADVLEAALNEQNQGSGGDSLPTSAGDPSPSPVAAPPDTTSPAETPQPGTDGSPVQEEAAGAAGDGSAGKPVTETHANQGQEDASAVPAEPESLFKAPTGPRGSKRKEAA